jgi:hypothetical protein
VLIMQALVEVARRAPRGPPRQSGGTDVGPAARKAPLARIEHSIKLIIGGSLASMEIGTSQGAA